MLAIPAFSNLLLDSMLSVSLVDLPSQAVLPYKASRCVRSIHISD